MRYHVPELNSLATCIRDCISRHGFTTPSHDNISEKLMLIVDEISEAHEDVRSGHWDLTYVVDARGMKKPSGFPTELADAMIRIFDICAAMNIDIAHMIHQKMLYNEDRVERHGRRF